MQYKFEFMVDEYVPPEYAERHLESKKRVAAEEIAKMLVMDYPFTKTDSYGRDIWKMEVVVTDAKRYQQFMDSINSGLLDMHTTAFMMALVERMEEPWDEDQEK